MIRLRLVTALPVAPLFGAAAASSTWRARFEPSPAGLRGRRAPRRFPLAGAALLFGLAGCAVRPVPIDRPAHHPANPDAPPAASRSRVDPFAEPADEVSSRARPPDAAAGSDAGHGEMHHPAPPDGVEDGDAEPHTAPPGVTPRPDPAAAGGGAS